MHPHGPPEAGGLSTHGKAWAVTFGGSIGALGIAAVSIYKSINQLPERFTGAGSYITFARQFAEGGILDNGRPPLYPLLLSPWYGLLGKAAPYGAAAMQITMALATIALVHRTVQRVTDSPWLAALAAACVWTNLALLREFLAARETGLMALLIMGAFAICCRASAPGNANLPIGAFDERTRSRRGDSKESASRQDVLAPTSATQAYAGASACKQESGVPRLSLPVSLGLVATLSWLTRPTGIIVLAAAAVFLWTAFTTARLKTLAPFAATTFLAIAPWAAYQALTHRPVHISGKSSATTLYYGTHPSLPYIYPYIDIDNLDPWVREELGPSPTNAQMHELTRARWHNAPAEQLNLTTRKAMAFLVPLQFPMGDGHPRPNVSGGWEIPDYRRLPLWALLLGISAGAGVIGWLAALTQFRRLPPHLLFSTITFGLIAGVHVLTFAETRYRQPLDPMMAAAAMMLWTWWRERRSAIMA